jgi:hypothetical protein
MNLQQLAPGADRTCRPAKHFCDIRVGVLNAMEKAAATGVNRDKAG